jgi:hypothetical protein
LQEVAFDQIQAERGTVDKYNLFRPPADRLKPQAAASGKEVKDIRFPDLSPRMLKIASRTLSLVGRTSSFHPDFGPISFLFLAVPPVIRNCLVKKSGEGVCLR